MADILDYCEGMAEVSFEPGAMLIEEGVPTRKLYVLIEGEVDVIRRDQQVTHIDEPGSIFGEMGVLLDMPPSATVQALAEVKAYVIDDALTFLSSRSEISLHLATLLARRLYYTTSYLVDLQEQAAGKREDLDLIDKILATLTQRPGAKKKKPAAPAKV
ncbi:MAG: cyclic nucleotide-binding protein [Devosia sp.]|nr:cyclic nucleotide-binding protein [Devosia sp.]